MPQVTVYIRDEDLPKWKGLEKKSEFIHNALANMMVVSSSDVPMTSDNPSQLKTINSPKKVPTPKLPDIPGIITADKLPSNVKLCKIHDTPLDSRGRCLQKGCKYA